MERNEVSKDVSKKNNKKKTNKKDLMRVRYDKMKNN